VLSKGMHAIHPFSTDIEKITLYLKFTIIKATDKYVWKSIDEAHKNAGNYISRDINVEFLRIQTKLIT